MTIPIPDLLVRLRQESVDGDRLHPAVVNGHGAKRTNAEALAWKTWRFIHAHPLAYRVGTAVGSQLRALQPAHLGAWTRYRTAPKLAARTLHQQVQQRRKKDRQS